MRVGIFGGSFSPVHNGHVQATEQFIRQCALDRLFIIPTGNHPVKKPVVPNEDRLEMCRRSFASVEKAEVSDIELARSGISYTYDTLLYFYEKGVRNLFLLCGSDMILSIERWYRSEEILKMTTLVHASRYEDSELRERTAETIKNLRERRAAKIMDLQGGILPLSSSFIREKIARGEDVSGMIPPAELQYIQEKGLFDYDKQ